MKDIFKRSGSYTVEISLLMPFIIGSILLVMLLCFYLHDICVISKDCAEVITMTTPEDIDAMEISEKLSKMTETDTLGHWVFNAEFNVETKEEVSLINADIDAMMKIEDFLFDGIMKSSFFTYKTKFSSYILDEHKYIRTK